MKTRIIVDSTKLGLLGRLMIYLAINRTAREIAVRKLFF
jgi:hypothetical protein